MSKKKTTDLSIMDDEQLDVTATLAFTKEDFAAIGIDRYTDEWESKKAALQEESAALNRQRTDIRNKIDALVLKQGRSLYSKHAKLFKQMCQLTGVTALVSAASQLSKVVDHVVEDVSARRDRSIDFQHCFSCSVDQGTSAVRYSAQDSIPLPSEIKKLVGEESKLSEKISELMDGVAECTMQLKEKWVTASTSG